MGKKSNQARFPAARIKKLIQADEDVGKVAQATPIVVSKAIELFLGCLVNECVKQAEARGTKKITAYGLKQTISEVAMFDFCSDIVAGVPDPINHDDPTDDKPKKKRQRKPKAEKGDSEGEFDVDEEEEKPKKVRRKASTSTPAGENGNGKAKGKAAVKEEEEEDEEDDAGAEAEASEPDQEDDGDDDYDG